MGELKTLTIERVVKLKNTDSGKGWGTENGKNGKGSGLNDGKNRKSWVTER